jgi:hypothetical protein
MESHPSSIPSKYTRIDMFGSGKMGWYYVVKYGSSNKQYFSWKTEKIKDNWYLFGRHIWKKIWESREIIRLFDFPRLR